MSDDFTIENLGTRQVEGVEQREVTQGGVTNNQDFMVRTSRTVVQSQLNLVEAKWLRKNYPNATFFRVPMIEDFPATSYSTIVNGRRFVIPVDIYDEALKVETVPEPTPVAKGKK